MSAEPRENAASLTEDALTLLSTVTAVAISNANNGSLSAVAAAAIAAAPFVGRRVVNLALDGFRAGVEDKHNRLVRYVATGLGFDKNEDLESLIAENKTQPWADTAIADGALAIAEEIDEAALPALGNLTTIRLKERRKADEQIKRALAFLQHLNADDVASLRELLPRVLVMWPDGETEQAIDLSDRSVGEPEGTVTVRVRDVVAEAVSRKRKVASFSMPSTRDVLEKHLRVLRFLKLHGFGTNTRGGSHGPDQAVHGSHAAR